MEFNFRRSLAFMYTSIRHKLGDTPWCIYTLNYILFFLTFYWSIVDLQYCATFRDSAKWFGYTHTHIYKYIYIYIFFFRFFSLIGYYRILSIVSYAIQLCYNLVGYFISVQSSVLLLSYVRLCATPWTAACWASLSITNSWSLLKLMSI